MGKDNTINGSCLCGKVRYQITGTLLSADHCHCSMCRKQHGAAFATYGEFNSNDFKWISGNNLLKIHETNSGSGWCFCRECGSSLAGSEKGEVNCIALGTIDGDTNIKPDSHIFVDSKANWCDIQDDLSQYKQRS